MASEFSAFNSLCINWESTLLMRSEESRMDLAQAIVIGPRDTAYANGIFVFDLQVRPPTMQQRVRFTYWLSLTATASG